MVGLEHSRGVVQAMCQVSLLVVLEVGADTRT